MRNRLAEAFERDLRSHACRAGGHDNCPHAIGSGGGLNPRRLRLEFGTQLCKCPCHAGCAVAGTRLCVSDQMWRDECSCPGAQARRAGLEQLAAEPRRPYVPYAPRHAQHGQQEPGHR